MGTRPVDRERGAIAPAMAIAVVLMAVLAVGTISIGRLAAVRSDAQQAADSAVLAAAQIIRDRGLPFDGAARSAAESLASRNSQLSVSYDWTLTETADAVDVSVTTTIPVSLPTLIFSGGSKDVQASATGRVTQSRFDDAERRLPKLVLVLDYSGSMGWEFDTGGVKIDVLEAAIAALLGADLMIDYGAVFYSSNVWRTIGIGASAPSQIINTMNAYTAGGNTDTSDAIRAATNILTATDNTGYYILLVSDGAPNNGGGMPGARNAAQAAWNSDVTIFTLEIRDNPPIHSLADFMTDIAGSPSSRHDPAYHYVATSAADIVDVFEDIVASIVCKVGPITPAPSDPATLRVFLSHSGDERAVPATADLAADADVEAYQYDPAEASIRLTATACDAVIDAGDEIVVRFDRPSLTD